MEDEINKRMKEMNFHSFGPNDNRALYSCSFGTFKKMYTGVLFKYHKDFTEKYIFKDKNSFDKLNTYLYSIKLIRNRCCHSNHLVSKRLNYSLNNLTLESFNINEFKNNFSKTINFIYRSLDNKDHMKGEFLIILKEYYDIWIKYCGKHSIDANIINAININW